ncbi:MAG: peptidase dimerization domain-containing protein, partial [Eubacteriales bacterium]|nr:peptidase dimerization domain-containing protein [Eubacteriales bacterium]
RSNFGTIEGGDQPSSVPGQCILRVDRRWVPEETLKEVYEGIQNVIDELKWEDPQFDAELRDMFEQDKLLPHQPFSTDETDPLIISTKRAMHLLEQKTGVPAGSFRQELTLFPAWSDAGFISNLTKASCIILGPGDLSVAHTREESIDLEEIHRAACLYKRIGMEYCGVE